MIPIVQKNIYLRLNALGHNFLEWGAGLAHSPQNFSPLPTVKKN